MIINYIFNKIYKYIHLKNKMVRCFKCKKELKWFNSKSYNIQGNLLCHDCWGKLRDNERTIMIDITSSEYMENKEKLIKELYYLDNPSKKHKLIDTQDTQVTIILTEKIITTSKISEISEKLEKNFLNIANTVKIRNKKIHIFGLCSDVLGSINRKDFTEVKIKKLNNGFLIKCHVYYKPSNFFWIFFILGVFSGILWIIPLIIYFYHKNLIKNAIKEVLKSSKDEL